MLQWINIKDTYKVNYICDHYDVDSHYVLFDTLMPSY